MVLTTIPGAQRHAPRGIFGDELVVVSRCDIRRAEQLLTETTIDTADGRVIGRVGDFVIFTASGEQYPIPSAIFFGTYEILGRVGTRYVCRRLLHARRAWPILSTYAEFNYGSDRATVTGDRGGWIYRSDDDDYGLINGQQNTKAHIVAGTVRALGKRDWEAWFRRSTLALTCLSPLLALLALSAFLAAQSPQHAGWAHLLLLAEGGLLLLGIGLAAWIRRHRWAARAAIGFAARTARQFQVAAEMLGESRSDLFPGMTLWRAAQSDAQVSGTFRPHHIRELKDQVALACERTRQELHHYHASEIGASIATVTVAAVILGCISFLVWVRHSEHVELAAIWLPSVVGALHTWNWSRQVSSRRAAAREFLAELQFVRAQLYALSPQDRSIPSNEAALEQLIATVRTLCHVVAVHTQRQLSHAIGEDPNLPV